MIRQVRKAEGFKDSEDNFFALKIQAEESQIIINMRILFDELGIGRGGEWSEEMIIKALLDNRLSLLAILQGDKCA